MMHTEPVRSVFSQALAILLWLGILFGFGDAQQIREPHPDADAYDCNDSYLEPADLSTYGQHITGLSVGVNGNYRDPADWFKWTAAVSGTLIVTVSENGNGPLWAAVWNGAGTNPLGFPSSSGGVHTISISVIGGLSYQISVMPVGGASNSGYTLDIDGTAKSGMNTVPVATTFYSISTEEATEDSVTILGPGGPSDSNGDQLFMRTHGDLWGRATANGNSVVYLPGTSINSFHWFTYVVDDGKGGRAKGTVYVFMEPLNGGEAFPGAEGFGALANGGRGGSVYEVTNWNDSGPGSLRYGVQNATARTIVFRVGGVIKLKSQLTVFSDKTIAGETAPGNGITLYGDWDGNGSPMVRVSGANVIVRHLRIRDKDQNRTGNTNRDTVSVYEAANVMFDHCSITWGNDEPFDISRSTDVTVQWCIIAEGLRPHSMGLFAGQESDATSRISIHHNLFAHNWARNPNVSTDQNSMAIEVVNNVVYNWGAWDARTTIGSFGFGARVYAEGGTTGPLFANVFGNYLKEGDDTKVPSQWPATSGSCGPLCLGNLGTSIFAVYMGRYSQSQSATNVWDKRSGGMVDVLGRLVGNIDEASVPMTWTNHIEISATTNATEAYDSVVGDGGAGPNVFELDETDQRILDDVDSRSGFVRFDPPTSEVSKLVNP